jgi:hypothetical protein
MLEKTFEEQIKENLQSLNHEQIVFFVWLCAVRALPLMGIDRSLYHWKEEYRQKHTYDIFNALDIVYAHATTDSLNDFEYIYDSVCKAFEYGTTKIVAEPTVLAMKILKTATYETDEIISCISYIQGIAKKHNMDFRQIWLNDIECIESNTFDNLDNSVDIYGICWDNLRYCFLDMNCVYWVDLYADIFVGGFKSEKKALEQRLSVPKEIQNQGAKSVADFLMNSKSFIVEIA